MVNFLQQEKDRMDIYHSMFLVARKDKLHNAPIVGPITDQTRILDVGTGTGIWAIDMAELVRSARGCKGRLVTDTCSVAGIRLLKCVVVFGGRT